MVLTPAICVNALVLEAPWATETEYADLDRGDARLSKRARTLIERLAARRTAGVPPTGVIDWGTSEVREERPLHAVPPLLCDVASNVEEAAFRDHATQAT